MIKSTVIDSLERKFNFMRAELDERGRRCWAASEALELGHGGIKAVASATGLCERTVLRGCKQLRQEWPPKDSDKRRIRQSGGGRKPLAEHDPQLITVLEALVGILHRSPKVVDTFLSQKMPIICVGLGASRNPTQIRRFVGLRCR